jgi:hypothetical protein
MSDSSSISQLKTIPFDPDNDPACEETFYDNFECLNLETMLKNVAGNETTDDIVEKFITHVNKDVEHFQTKRCMENILVHYNEQNDDDHDRLCQRPPILREKKKAEQLFYHIFKFCGIFNDWSDVKIMENVKETLEAMSVFKEKSQMQSTIIKYGKKKVQYQRAFYKYMLAIRQFPYRFIICNHASTTPNAPNNSKKRKRQLATVIRVKNSEDCPYVDGGCPFNLQSCACSQIIYEKCIFMRKDGRYMVVGNDCVYMLTRTKPIRYLKWIDKWKKENVLTASNCPESNIQKQKDSGIINQLEFDFLINIGRKKKLTDYQLYHRTMLRCRLYESCRPDCESSPTKDKLVGRRILELMEQLPNCSMCSKTCLQLNKDPYASEPEHLCGNEQCVKEYERILEKKKEKKKKKLELQRQQQEEKELLHRLQEEKRRREEEEEELKRKEKIERRQRKEKKREELQHQREEEEFQQHMSGSIPIGFGKYYEMTLVNIMNKHPDYILQLVNMDHKYNISFNHPVQFRAIKTMIDSHHSSDLYLPFSKRHKLDKDEQYSMEQTKKKEMMEEKQFQDYVRGDISIGFGKYKNETLPTIVRKDRSYAEWFACNVVKHPIIKNVFKKLLEEDEGC